MYNDYYLNSIDNKLDLLSDIKYNQETIISNQETIIFNQNESNNLICSGFVWLYLILFFSIFYNFTHRIFNHHK